VSKFEAGNTQVYSTSFHLPAELQNNIAIVDFEKKYNFSVYCSICVQDHLCASKVCYIKHSNSRLYIPMA